MAQQVFKDSTEMAAALTAVITPPIITGYRPIRGAAIATRRWFDMAAEAVTNQATQNNQQADFNLIETPTTLAERWQRAIEKVNNEQRFR